MAESMKGLHRTHRCTEVSNKNVNETVTVMGWVAKSRNKGGIIFVDLRDRSGILQVIFEEDKCGQISFAKAEKLRSEFVVAITGEVALRAGGINKNLATGDIEIIAKDIRILSESETPPFPIEENSKTKEEILVAMQKRILDIFPKLREELRDNTEDTLESALEVFSKNEENLLKNFPEYNHAEMDFWVQSRTDEDTRKRFAGSYELWRQEIREVLDKYVPNLPDNLKKILPAQYVSMLEGFTIQYLIDENNMDMSEYFAMSRKLILNMVKPYM